jgi:hypothetical protein
MEIDKVTFDGPGNDLFIWRIFILCTHYACNTKVLFFINVHASVTFTKVYTFALKQFLRDLVAVN